VQPGNAAMRCGGLPRGGVVGLLLVPGAAGVIGALQFFFFVIAPFVLCGCFV